MKRIHQLFLSLFFVMFLFDCLKANISLFSLPTNEICIDEAIELNANYTGFDSYLWDLGNGITSIAVTPTGISYSQEGVYDISLQVQSAAGIHLLNSVTIDTIPNTWGYNFILDPAPDLYIIISDAEGNVLCSTPAANLNYSIPYTFFFNSILIQQNYTIAVWEYDLLDADDYLGTIVFNGADEDGVYEDVTTGLRVSLNTSIVNELTYTESIAVAPALQGNIEVLQYADDFGQNASIGVTIDGITTNLTYQWSNGANTSILTNIPAGEYSVLVTAPGFCESVFYISYNAFFEDGTDPGCQNMAVYGNNEADVNEPFEMIKTQDGHFVFVGEWNDEAFIQKVDVAGNVLHQVYLGNEIGGNSRISDLIELSDGSIVVAGDCEFCEPGEDSRRVFVLKMNANLMFDETIGVRKFAGLDCCPGYVAQANPYIVKKDGDIFLTAKLIRSTGLNFNDFSLMQLDASLDSLWAKAYNSCGNCGFENPRDIIATSNGLGLVVDNFFTDSVSVFNIDVTGNVIWKTRLGWPVINAITETTDNKLAVTGLVFPNGQDAIVQLLEESTGELVGQSLVLGDALKDRGIDIESLGQGDLLLGMTSEQPGQITSRIYKLTANPLAVADTFSLIPSPNQFTDMAVRNLIPLNNQGNAFAAVGTNGAVFRSFFYSQLGVEYTSTTTIQLCEGESYVLPDGSLAEESGIYTYNFLSEAGCDSTIIVDLSIQESYQENIQANFCKGEVYELPDGTFVEEAGTYEIFLNSTFGCDSTIIVQLEEYVEFQLEDTQITPDSGSGDGAILLQLSGGNPPYQYEWEDGSNESSLTGLSAGIYGVTVFDNCQTSLVFSIHVPEEVVAIFDPIEDIVFKVYPNPFSDQFELEIKEESWDKKGFLAVYSAQGQLVYNQQVTADFTKVKLGYIPSGVYKVRIQTIDGRVGIRTLIKQ